MRICIIDSITKICVTVVMLDTPDQWIPVEGLEVANNQDGGIGMQLTDTGWISLEPFIPISWDMVREDRNGRLSVCDWTMLPDSPLSIEKRQEWVDYRQALRDITVTFTETESIVWPTQPT
jgi:hypothetical protein